MQPLPVYLNIAPHTTVDDIYQTTTSTTHDYKESETTYNHPQYKKSPSLLKVNYTLDTINKVYRKQGTHYAVCNITWTHIVFKQLIFLYDNF